MSYTNRLAQETSPYLLQHAHNPVDWYAWGPEAFEAARSQNKPIFLSVGYSTCYWCHVMERECFENEAIAAEMNKRFINIKVDREERPDVDQLYMTAVQVLTRHGGWPMSVFLLPDLRPFYGGTYFPPTDMHGRPGFVTVLRAIEDAYHNRLSEVESSAEQITNILHQLANPLAPSKKISIDQAFIDELVQRSASDYDPVNGGFGSAPKFPRETQLELLLTSEISNLKSKIRHSLDAMANGGIRDHLGGGFHRYSTDAQWLVPHFEIMLYDNAMLGWCYVEVHRQTGEPRYARVARGIFDFVLREMTSPDGAFYTAFDAEVDAKEGDSYLWTIEEVESILGKSDAELFAKVHGLDRGTNFRDPHHPGPERNVLYLPDGPAMEDDPRIVTVRQKLYEARRQRKQPLLDTKIITSWNALMIRALAHGGQVLKEDRYLAAARRAAGYLWTTHRSEDGLFRTSRDGVKKYRGFLDDYAFLAQAMLALGGEWKDRAEELSKIMLEKFADPQGGFFFTEKGADDLIVRQKVASDSPLPSGNGVAAMVMLELGDRETAKRLLTAFAHQLVQQGEGMSAMVQSAMQYVGKHGPIEIAATRQADDERPLSPAELAQRVVSISANWSSPTQLSVHLNILKPFHINGYHPAEGMIAADLRIDDAQVSSIQYPPGQTWEGQVRIGVELKKTTTKPIRASLKYQACDDSACLPEVMVHFEISPS